MFMPISGVTVSAAPLIITGFFAGVIGGFFGIGGAFMVTPALNIFGFPIAYAVGTDMAHMVGKSIISTFRHWKLGHVDVMLGSLMIIGTTAGVELGARTVARLTEMGVADPVIRHVYTIVLTSLGLYMLWQYFSANRRSMLEFRIVKDVAGNRLTGYLQSLKLPPVVHLKRSGFSISIWIILLVGLLTGYLAGFLGVGGGFVRVPALMFVIGMPMKLAVGTDLFEIIISSTYGAFTYAIKGLVDLYGAMIMLMGAAVGAQIGTIATRYVFGIRMRLYFACCILGTAASVVAKQMSYYEGQAYLAGMRAQLAAQGMDAGKIAGILGDRDQVQAMLAANPTWQQLAESERILNAISEGIMLIMAAGLSLLIISLCLRGIVVERKKGVILGG
ncbi:MAG: sulfite exporter TauE/SafE family protein [Peptococcaceae bacterium]|nr:sulfite exporter TauE/SafE family protein [Peptococcaceae bacterium]